MKHVEGFFSQTDNYYMYPTLVNILAKSIFLQSFLSTVGTLSTEHQRFPFYRGLHIYCKVFLRKIS